jgi:divalent metal cation (Fe/Co/Zn/Cd) transporter
LLYAEYFSIFVTLTSFIIYTVLAFEDASVSAFAFATDSFLDIVAYVVVIWRFSKTGDLHSDSKDRVSLISLGVVFVVSSIGIEYESINNLVFRKKPIASLTFILIGFAECIVFCALTIAKFIIANKLGNNTTIISDAINSLLASFSVLSMSIGMILFTCDPGIWYLDAVLGFLIGAFVFLYGSKLLIQNLFFAKL